MLHRGRNVLCRSKCLDIRRAVKWVTVSKVTGWIVRVHFSDGAGISVFTA